MASFVLADFIPGNLKRANQKQRNTRLNVEIDDAIPLIARHVLENKFDY
jgi:hypothetical protein